MFKDEYKALANGAKGKLNLLNNNPLGYFVSSMVAGLFICFGNVIFLASGSTLKEAGSPAWKIIACVCFAAALSFVIMAGSELFTGNNLAMAAGAFKGTVTWGEAIKVWIVCYIGNLVGSVLSAFAYFLTGHPSGEAMSAHITGIVAAKMTCPLVPLLFRAILCNTLVCIAVWCGAKMKTESGKLILIIWCIAVFMIGGFEHSVANMSSLTLGLLLGGNESITIGGYIYNVGVVTIGNMIGGILLVALPYYLISKD